MRQQTGDLERGHVADRVPHLAVVGELREEEAEDQADDGQRQRHLEPARAEPAGLHSSRIAHSLLGRPCWGRAPRRSCAGDRQTQRGAAHDVERVVGSDVHATHQASATQAQATHRHRAGEQRRQQCHEGDGQDRVTGDEALAVDVGTSPRMWICGPDRRERPVTGDQRLHDALADQLGDADGHDRQRATPSATHDGQHQRDQRNRPRTRRVAETATAPATAAREDR